MSAAMKPVEDAELHAYVDGQLGNDRAQEVVLFLEQNPVEAARVAQYAAQRRAMRASLQPRFDEAVPPRLRIDRVRAGLHRKQMARFRGIAAIAAAVLVCVVSGLIIYPRIFGTAGEGLIAQAFEAREGGLSVERQLAASSVSTSEARDALAATALALPIRVPDLTPAGFTLSAIAIYPERDHAHALQLSYTDRQGKLFTVFLHRAGGADKFDLQRQGKMQICIWQNEDMGAVMLGEMSAKEMLKVATLTYGDLNF